MLSPDKICGDFSTRAARFLEDSQNWREEAALMYAVRDSRPLLGRPVSGGAFQLDEGLDGGNYRKPEQPNKILTVANVAAPYLRACVGMLLRGSRTFDAYSVDPSYRDETDVMNDGIKWAVDKSGYNAVRAVQIEDALTRGVGAMVGYLDFTDKRHAAGVPVMQSKHHIMFDRAGGDNISSSTIKWCGYADPMYRDDLDEYIEHMLEGKKPKGSGAASFREEMLKYTAYEDREELDFLYHYFWREWQDVRDVENIFVTRPELLLELGEKNPLITEITAAFAQEQQLDIQRANYWTLDGKGWQAFLDYLENVEYYTGEVIDDVKVEKRKARFYYRAQIADGNLLMASPAFTQDCHPMSLVTGYFDRTSGTYYGMMRAASYLQEMLNEAVANYGTYAARSATGGNIGIKGMGAEIAPVIKKIINSEQVIPLPQTGDAVNLGTPDAAQAMAGFVDMLINMIPLSFGVPKEILGMMNTDTPAATLFKAAQEQMNISLATLRNNCDAALLAEGSIIRDLVMEIAKTKPEVLPKISPGKGEEPYFLLSQQNMARNYSIRLVAQDGGEDARHEEFMKMAEFMQGLPEQLRMQAMPELVRLSSFDEDVKDNLIKALTPPPADPAAAQEQMRRMSAETDLLEAQSQELLARAARAGGEAAHKEQESRATVIKDLSSAEKSRADAAKVIQEMGLQSLAALPALSQPTVSAL